MQGILSFDLFSIFFIIMAVNMSLYIAREYIPGFSEWINDIQDSWEGEEEKVIIESTLQIEYVEVGCKYCKNISGLMDAKGNCISCGAPLEEEKI